MNLQKLFRILDRQPSLTTYVQRTVNEDFGDEELIKAANPDYQETEEACRKLIEEMGTDDAPFMQWITEAERAAYRVGVAVGLRLAGKAEKIKRLGHRL